MGHRTFVAGVANTIMGRTWDTDFRVLTMTPVVGIQTHPASGGDCYRHLWLCLYGTSPEVRLARLLLLRAGIGQIANDLPGPIILALEDVHTRLERADGSAGPGMR